MQRISSKTGRLKPDRSGATLVETAMVMPFFVTLLFAVIEFSHAYLIVGTLNSAAKRAARMGAAEGATTLMVTDRVDEILSASMLTPTPGMLVQVKDASVFDDPNVDPSTIDYSSLPDVEVDDLESRQLFVVRVQVPFNEVALMPPLWANSVTLYSQSVMRHE